MKFQIQMPAGTYTTHDGFVRRLEHPSGPIHIIDQLFETTFVDSLHTVLSRIPFIANDTDTEATSHILHMKCELPARPLMSGDIQDKGLLALLPKAKGASHLSAVARVTAQALGELYPEYADVNIGRIHANCLPYGDLLNTHEDGGPGEVLTGLYFVNAIWQANWHGELILCDPLGEPLYAVAPRPGRIVLFPGDIPHRAGMSSRACYVHRLTIGHKFRALKKDTS